MRPSIPGAPKADKFWQHANLNCHNFIHNQALSLDLAYSEALYPGTELANYLAVTLEGARVSSSWKEEE